MNLFTNLHYLVSSLYKYGLDKYLYKKYNIIYS